MQPVYLVLAAASLALAQPVKLAHVGNSITAGSLPGVDPYPVKLQKLLGSGYQVENDGVSGCTLMKRANKPYWTQGKLANAFAFKPALVTIKLGTNDSKTANWVYKADFAKDLRALVDTLAGMPSKPAIWLCLPAPAWPINGENRFTINGEVIKNEILPLIRQVAAEKKLPLIDLHTPLSGMRSHFQTDGVHPDQVAQDTIAAVMHRALTAVTARFAIAPPAPARPRFFAGEALIPLPQGSSVRVEILSPLGRTVRAATLSGPSRMPLRDLTPGRYVLSLETSAGRSAWPFAR